MQQTEQNKLEQIIHLSQTKSFAMPSLDFMSSVDVNHFWIPEKATPWFYLPSYANTNFAVKKRLNQLHAMGVNEIFSLFEEEVIFKILKKLRSQNTHLTNLQQQAIDYFCSEELKHSEMFHRLNLAAAPQYYQSERYYLIKNRTRVSQVLIRWMTEFPNVFLIWVWMGIFFEERTLMYAKEYIQDKSALLSPVFKEIHRLHLIEETRHVQMDEMFVDLFYRNAHPLLKKISAITFKKIIRDFSSPKRLTRNIAEVLKTEMTDAQTEKQINQLVSELPTLSQNTDFQKQMFGQEAAPRTHALILQFPELSGIL